MSGARPAGVVLYRGPSLIDGAPIVAVATFETSNRKTGDMVQTWILRADRDPVRAVATGADRSICGACPHRGDGDGGRSCYVNVGQAPRAVWLAARRRRYLRRLPDSCPDWLHGRAVRLGSYGDPGAVPVAIWRGLLAWIGADRWTGYTHQWRSRPALRTLCMASCDSFKEAAEARRRGWRPFLVLDRSAEAPEDAGLGRAIACPAQGPDPRTTCERCALCAGSSERTAGAPAVWIAAHGSGAVHIGAS
jgi:hypothetical protein